ncbi:MAG: thioesterase [Cytophagales bacterium]|nr:thioesterase [Cytophagales bacterium]
MTVPKIWKGEFRLCTFHMDPAGKAQIMSICNFLQEGASMHAECAGFGFNDMMRRNQVWVLTRLKVNITEYPAWKDNMILETWSRGKEGIFYIRDFNINNDQNKSIIKATSSWAAINLKTRRPGTVKGLEDALYGLKDKKAIEEKVEKLPALKKPEFLRARKIEYTDIDLIYHVNNVKFIELLINSFPIEILSELHIDSLEINYLGEVKLGEEVLIFQERLNENHYLANMVRESDKKEVCRCLFCWKRNN